LVIDAHCHAGHGDGLTGPWDTHAPLETHLERARQAGIGHTVLLPAFHSNYAAANAEVGELVRNGAGRFSMFAFVHATRDAGRVLQVVRSAVQRYGACGIKVHRHDARLSREICEVALALRLPVLYDATGQMATVELAAEAYPSVNFVIPHLGSFADDWFAQRTLIDILARRPNVYTDTAGVRRFDLLVEAVKRAGARKVLFGSDGPWLHPGLELAKVHALKLSAAQEADILGRNWLRLTATARGTRVLRTPRFTADPHLRATSGAGGSSAFAFGAPKLQCAIRHTQAARCSL
jgi:predicted TIM-barrel fold metal-dependent hydrolase